MKIEIWSDVVCPFCYIGKASLEQALAQSGAEAEVIHRSFRLQPGQTPVPVADMLAQKYGLTGAAAEASQKRVIDMAASFGLDFHLAGTVIGDTLDAHKLLVLAGEKGVQQDLLDRLYRAYFIETQPIFNRETLLSLGAESGLVRGDMEAALASDALAGQVVADQQQANAYGVRGVPFAVIDGKYAISGAQPPQAFLQAFDAAKKDAAEALAGDVCGVDGCD